MYAVIADGVIHYLGVDRIVARTIFDSKSGATILYVESLGELRTAFASHNKARTPETESKSEDPSRLEEVLRKLEKIDLAGEAEVVFTKTRENGEHAIGQVRSLGLRGLKGLGEGFTAIGSLLQKAGEEEVVENPSKKGVSDV